MEKQKSIELLYEVLYRSPFMKKGIKQRLVKKPIEVQLVQGKVPLDVIRMTRSILKKEHRTWNEVLTACLMQFNEEFQEKK